MVGLPPPPQPMIPAPIARHSRSCSDSTHSPVDTSARGGMGKDQVYWVTAVVSPSAVLSYSPTVGVVRPALSSSSLTAAEGYGQCGESLTASTSPSFTCNRENSVNFSNDSQKASVGSHKAIGLQELLPIS